MSPYRQHSRGTGEPTSAAHGASGMPRAASLRRLGRGRAQLRRAERAEHPQDGQGLGCAAALGRGHHGLGGRTAHPAERGEDVGTPQLRLQRAADLRQHHPRLGQYRGKGIVGR